MRVRGESRRRREESERRVRARNEWRGRGGQRGKERALCRDGKEALELNERGATQKQTLLKLG